MIYASNFVYLDFSHRKKIWYIYVLYRKNNRWNYLPNGTPINDFSIPKVLKANVHKIYLKTLTSS